MRSSEATADGTQAVGLALSAARRGFRAILHPAELAGATSEAFRSEAAMQRIVALEAPPTPEQLIGYLSRGHVPMLHCRLTRLHRQRPAHWVLLAGFDGYLFRVIDPEGSLAGPDSQLAVTMGELRACLRASQPCRPTALVLLKPALILSFSLEFKIMSRFYGYHYHCPLPCRWRQAGPGIGGTALCRARTRTGTRARC